uniref:Uncharacterized protein n=1 Tax=Acrobeloides nanus TaxID=290746 RepID=A0A914E6W2_9BILA
MDTQFINNITVDAKQYTAIYRSKPLERGEDLYLGCNYCDSILLTSSISTFGFWMSYLKTTRGYVFYNSQQRKAKPHISDWDAFHWYPIDWIMLTQNKKTGEIYREFWNYTQFL